MKKKLKIILTVAISSLLTIAAVVAIILNYHNIYVFSETQGWFRNEMEIKETDASSFRSYSLDELKKENENLKNNIRDITANINSCL